MDTGKSKQHQADAVYWLNLCFQPQTKSWTSASIFVNIKYTLEAQPQSARSPRQVWNKVDLFD